MFCNLQREYSYNANDPFLWFDQGLVVPLCLRPRRDVVSLTTTAATSRQEYFYFSQYGNGLSLSVCS